VATAFWSQLGTWLPPMFNQTQTVVPDAEAARYPWRADSFEQKGEEKLSPYLSFQNSVAAVNQPLPLGIVLNKSSGGETLILNGLPEGTSLSSGNPLSSTRWSVPASDLERTFISAPENFNGTMPVTATLYSSAHDVLETKEVRFEWSHPQKEDRPARIDASATTHSESSTGEPTSTWLTMVMDWLSQTNSIALPRLERPFEQSPPVQPIPSATPAELMDKGERLLREGNIAAARPLLKRAAEAGSADAALDLAMTFDPAFLPNGNRDGPTADPAEAARWYQRALNLGRKDVAPDLDRVSGMIKNTAPR